MFKRKSYPTSRCKSLEGRRFELTEPFLGNGSAYELGRAEMRNRPLLEPSSGGGGHLATRNALVCANNSIASTARL